MLKDLKEIKTKMSELASFSMQKIKSELGDAHPNLDIVDYWTQTFRDSTNLTADLQRLIEYYTKHSDDLKTGMAKTNKHE